MARAALPLLLALLCLSAMYPAQPAPRCRGEGADSADTGEGECDAEVDSVGLPQLRLDRAQRGAEESFLNSRGRLKYARWSIRALQWNPHWQCFVNSPSLCSPNAQQALTAQLQSGLDFANVVELEPEPAYQPPSPWKGLTEKCGYDVITLFYNSANWSPVGKSFVGCMDGNDRPFIVQSFAQRSSGSKLVAVGAHFPHGYEWSSLTSAISAAMSSAGTNRVLFMADTNTDMSSSEIFSKLGVPNSSKSHSTALKPTCCNTYSPGFIFPFDRVIANFGSGMSSQELFDPLPSWATEGNNEFHKAIVGTVSIGLGSLVETEASV